MARDVKSADQYIARQRMRARDVTVTESLGLADAVTDVGTGSNHTTTLTETVLLMGTSGSSVTLTLSDEAAEAGKTYILIDQSGAAGTNSIDVTAESDSQHNVNGSNQDISLGQNNGIAIISADEDGDWWVGIAG